MFVAIRWCSFIAVGKGAGTFATDPSLFGQLQPRKVRMNKDRIDGAGKEVKDAIKEAAGKVTGNRETQAEGKAEKIVGKVQNHIGKAEDAAKHDHKH
jgi:uncharacterized protein YjbJ (UPF0337 family)